MSASTPPRVLVLGCGFAGGAFARAMRAGGQRVAATTRDPARAEALRAEGIDARAEPALTAALVRKLARGADVLVAFPPDGATDAIVAGALADTARAVVYLSTTGVYGAARGRVDERTPVDPSSPKAAARLAAEDLYRAIGATVLRPAGIYGPGRGLHLRVARGAHKLPDGGVNVVSRVHVEDLASFARAALAHAEGGARGETYAVADDAPVPQVEAVRWLCERLALPMPPSIPAAEAPETLRHDRAVDNALAKRVLGVVLAYPTYREGFAHCLRADGLGHK